MRLSPAKIEQQIKQTNANEGSNDAQQRERVTDSRNAAAEGDGRGSKLIRYVPEGDEHKPILVLRATLPGATAQTSMNERRCCCEVSGGSGQSCNRI